MKEKEIQELLEMLDTEIGSTITYSDEQGKVLDNMKRANLLLLMLKEKLGVEF